MRRVCGVFSCGRRLCFSGPFEVRHGAEREALILLLICALDMYTTLWWVMTGIATEANPLLAPTFDWHPLAFVLIKCLSFYPALLLACRLARWRTRLVAWLLRLVATAYILIYVTAIPA